VNRRFVGLAVALLLATIGTLAIVAYVHGADSRALDKQKVVSVLVVQKTVSAGTPAEQLGDRVKLESVVQQVVAQGAVTKVKELKGLVASATLVPGEQLVRGRFVNASTYRATGSGVDIPSDLLQTTIALDPERALGGVLTPGTKVAVTASFEDKSNVHAESHMILHQVLVTNVQMRALNNPSSSNNSSSNTSNTSNSSGVKPGDAPSGQLLVTLALDAPSSERVIFAAERGSLWLSNEPSGAPTAGTKVIDRDNVLR
jgi:pilus assembly protein CpaB